MEGKVVAQDLGTIGQPITNLFPQPKTPSDWNAYMLSAEQIEHFSVYGYISGIKVLDAEQIDVLRKDLIQVSDSRNPGNEFFYEYHSNESENPDTVLFHALGAWRVTRAFHDILWAPAFRMPAYQLLGKSFRLFHDQLFSKPARHGGVVAWHQDFSYWTWTSPMAHLTSWIGLDDVDSSNGCMYYVPGSHTWGLLRKTGLSGDMDAVRGVLTDEQLACFDRRVPIEMKAGEASFHHPCLMHGSYENRSERPRRATLINVFADGVVSNRDDGSSEAPGADNYPVVPKGEKMSGTYYPILFDPAREFLDPSVIPTIDRAS